MRYLSASLVALLGATLPVAVKAQDVAAFYKGKTITLVIASTAGGYYDVVGRTVAHHLSENLPGNPNIVVQNMPGAGGIVPANNLFRTVPKDGTVIGLIQNTIPFEPLLGTKEALYDPNAFNYLGTSSVEVGLIVLWHTSPVNSLEDLRKRETPVASSGEASTPSFFGRVLNETLGTKLRFVMGYPGQNDAFLAMERGEIEGYPSTFYSSLQSTRPEWLSEHKVKFIVQYGPHKQPELADVPYVPDLITNPDDKALFEAASAPLSVGTPFVAPPGVPGDRVAALRKAMTDVFADKSFIADMGQLHLTVDPRSGEEAQATIARANAAPQEVVERLRRLAERQ